MESPQLYLLVVIGVLTSVVSIYYYLRVVIALYFRDPLRPLDPTDAASTRAALILTAMAVLLLGILPGSFIEPAGPVIGK
jgi:NADH-quinone oxidoreductase subunit N